MKDKLLIIGAGGHGRVVADIALRMSSWSEIAFIDDNIARTNVMGFSVIGTQEDIDYYIDEYEFIVAIGNNSIRRRVQLDLEQKGASIATAVHPTAIIGTNVSVQSGTVIMAGVIVNCCTIIGSGCIINTGSSLDHDNLIDDFVHISPGVRTAGNVRISEETWLGVGSIISNNVYITNKCMIGAGAVVITDLEESGTYIGVPVKKHESK